MRRKEREVTDRKQIEKVMELCSCCGIGFCDEGKIYIVPVNFGYEYGKDSCTIFFHGAQEGRKFELIKEEPEVGFEMDTSYQLKTADVACGYSSYFQSIIGTGRVTVVEDNDEKIYGLNQIMKHVSGKSEWSYEESMLRTVGVFKLEVEEMSCKER